MGKIYLLLDKGHDYRLYVEIWLKIYRKEACFSICFSNCVGCKCEWVLVDTGTGLSVVANIITTVTDLRGYA